MCFSKIKNILGRDDRNGGCTVKKICLIFICLCTLLITAVSCDNNKKDEKGDNNRYRDIIEEERNETGLTWPEGQAMPSMAYPVENVDAINVTGKTNNVRSMLASLQGIINREKPRIYLYSQNDRNEKWAENMGIEYTLTKEEDEIITKYIDELEGLVVWDAKQVHTLNLATTYAGIYNTLVVTEKLAEKYTQEPFNLEIKENYVGKFTSQNQVYEYLYDNLWDKCQKRLVMGLSPTDHNCHSRDLAVASNAAVVWIDLVNRKLNTETGQWEDAGDKPEDIELMSRFFKDCEAGETHFAGWWVSEGRGVGLSSTFGIPTIPADFFENYTLYAGTSRELDIPVVPAKPKLEGKAYIAFTFSDGDNMQYCEHHMKSAGMWESTRRREIPITWTFSPPIYDAAPQMLNYFYKTSKGNDFLIAGPSGVGYTNPSVWEESDPTNEYYLKYVQRSDSYFRRTAFNFTTVWHSVTSKQEELVKNNWGSLIGYSTQTTLPNQEAYKSIGDGIVKIQTSPPYDGNIPRVEQIISDQLSLYRGIEPRFIMPQIIAWEANVADVVNLANRLKDKFGDKVEFVRVDHLCMLFAEYKNNIYNASLQAKKVEASGAEDGFEASKIVDGSFATKQGWKCSDEGDKWVVIDLEEEYKLSRYILQNAATGYYKKELNTKDYKVQASTDGKEWKDIDVVTGNTSNIVDKMTEEFTARYVRLLITNPGEDGVARVQEFEVWGVKVNPIKFER